VSQLFFFFVWGCVVGSEYYVECSIVIVSTKLVNVCCDGSGIQLVGVLHPSASQTHHSDSRLSRVQ
jgi:hypothetical protein